MMRLFATLIVCGVLGQGRSPTRDIPLPEGTSRATCVAEDGRGYSTPSGGRTLPVECVGAPETVVRCDVDGAEPLDLTLAALCAADTVPAARARTVRVLAKEPTEITVEWVRFGPPDRSARVVARRVLSFKGRVALPVAPRDDRFLRFVRPGASPITMHGDALAAGDDWSLPVPAPGGELVARASAATISAIKYRLIGSALAETVPIRDIARFPAVPAGAYDLEPEYEGGIRGNRTSVNIRPGETTFVALPEEPVGGVRIAAAPELCAAHAALAISRIRSDPHRGTSSVQSVVTLPARSDECVHVVAGLDPGDYEASFRGEDGQLAAQQFQVAAQAWTSLFAAPDIVRLSGVVRMNGRPLPNATIRFIPEGGRPAGFVTEADAQGRYSLTLPDPGRFDVWFGRAGLTMLGNERDVTVSFGTNYVDWDLDGATLSVTLKGWAREAPVDISLTPLSMSKPGKVAEHVRLRLADPLPVVFTGIGYGRYAVQAREHSIVGARPGRVAGATVTLDEGQLELGIALVLTDSRGVIRIVDERGQPIPSAVAKAGDEHLLQMSAGVFSLGDVPPASYVLASAPGFAPTLRLVPSESPFDLALTPGIQVRLHFLAGEPPRAHGSLAWPGTDAPVPLHLFAVTPVPGAGGHFIVHNFPAAAAVVYIAGPFDPPERYQPVTPDANGVVRIK